MQLTPIGWTPRERIRNRNTNKDVASLKERNPADLGKRLAKLEADWEKSKRSFVVKRALIEDHMQEATWYRQDQDKVIRRLGIDKQGNLITPDP